MRRIRGAKWWACPVVVALMTAAALVGARPASAADDYPYRDADPGELDSRGFYFRHCTSFVAFRMAQRGTFDNYMSGPNGVQGHWHHARDWAANAERIGFRVDSVPVRGAIAHWYAGEQGAKDLGHVAFVDEINADGSVIIEEYNWSPYAYTRRGPLRAPRYIHVYDDAASVPQEASAQAPPRVKPPQVPEDAEVASAPPAEPRAVDARDTLPPDGELTAPAPSTPVFAGEAIAVGGEFTDDSQVAQVNFFVADDSYRWRAIGTDAHGGNGMYSVVWLVDYPAAARLNFYAQAIDGAGNRAVESIRGIEGIRIASSAQGSTAPAGPDRAEGVPVSLSRGEAAGSSLVGAASLAGSVGVLGTFGVFFARRRRRTSLLAR